jgi:hypothetical protein
MRTSVNATRVPSGEMRAEDPAELEQVVRAWRSPERDGERWSAQGYRARASRAGGGRRGDPAGLSAAWRPHAPRAGGAAATWASAASQPARGTAPWLAFGVTRAIWSSTFLFIRIGNDTTPPICAGVIVAGLTAASCSGARRGRGRATAGRDLVRRHRLGVSLPLLYWGSNAQRHRGRVLRQYPAQHVAVRPRRGLAAAAATPWSPRRGAGGRRRCH